MFKAPFASPASYGDRDGQTNYIKRLIGLPGDVIEVVDGDLYVARAEDVPGGGPGEAGQRAPARAADAPKRART